MIRKFHTLITDRSTFNICEMLKLAVKLFKSFGYFRPLFFDRNWTLKLLYHTWTLIWISWYLGALIVAQALGCYMFWPDLAQVLGAAFVLLTNTVHVLKLLNLIYRRDLIKDHIEYFCEMDEMEYEDGESRKIIQNYEYLSFRDVFIYGFLANTTCLGWGAIGDTYGNEWGFPLVAWYPFNTAYTPMYQLVYVHQVVAVWMAALFCVTIDTFTSNLCVQICCQLELIKKQLRDAGKKYEKNLTAKPDSWKFHNDILYKELINIIQRHCKLMDVCGELSLTIGWTVFAQFAVSSLIICCSLYQIVAMSNQNMMTLFAVFAYMISMCVQVFLYCYNGNEIILTSFSIADEAAKTPWHLFSGRCKKSLMMLIQKAQKPLIVRAGNLIPLSLDTFTSIMKTSYSFFSIIRNFK